VTLLLSITVAVLFGAGCYLAVKADLLRVVAGVILIANAANLTLMGAGLSRGRPPIDARPGEEVADPLVQAMTLTAIVIGFGVTALLLAIVHRVYVSHETVDLDELSAHEARAETEREREAMEAP
jgi:multicomponent Na+:H+ antiporter subunit C